MRCAVNWCNFGQVHLFKFPNKVKLRNKWYKYVNRVCDNFWPNSSLGLCSKHFSEDQYNTKTGELAPNAEPNIFPKYQCQSCDSCFSRESALDIHEKQKHRRKWEKKNTLLKAIKNPQLTEGLYEQMFKCTYCKKVSRNFKTIREHVRNVHFNCVPCGQTFETEPAWVAHNKEVHETKIQQTYTPRSYSPNPLKRKNVSTEPLKPPEKLKRYQCQYCSKASFDLPTIVKHIANEHAKKPKKPLESKKFKDEVEIIGPYDRAYPLNPKVESSNEVRVKTEDLPTSSKVEHLNEVKAKTEDLDMEAESTNKDFEPVILSSHEVSNFQDLDLETDNLSSQIEVKTEIEEIPDGSVLLNYKSNIVIQSSMELITSDFESSMTQNSSEIHDTKAVSKWKILQIKAEPKYLEDNPDVIEQDKTEIKVEQDTFEDPEPDCILPD